jgi:hypothetical protein
MHDFKPGCAIYKRVEMVRKRRTMVQNSTLTFMNKTLFNMELEFVEPDR